MPTYRISGTISIPAIREVTATDKDAAIASAEQDAFTIESRAEASQEEFTADFAEEIA